MIEIPDGICDEVFNDEHFPKGTVIRLKYHFTNSINPRNKYFVSLSLDPSANPIVFVITTSKIDFFLRHPQFNNDAITVTAKSLDYFTEDTVIDCRQIHSLSRDKLRDHFKQKTLQFIGRLPLEYIEKIDAVIPRSKLISKEVKRLILG